jgi:uncharacterized protein YbjT (DUF2867 family)
MTTNTHDPATLVVGGTGMSGRRVADRLTARGARVRIGSRTGEPPFDWADDTTWTAALDGVSSAYLTYHPDIGFPEAAQRIAAFAKLALDRGAHRLVLLSGRGSESALQAEQALRESGVDWTVIRSSWFAQNFGEGPFCAGVRDGVIAFPAGDVAEPFVSADDIADIAVAALTDARHLGQVYEVSGPRLLTFAEVAQEISGAVGRPVRYTPITFPELADALTGSGLPEQAVAQTVDVFSAILDGRNAHLTDGVRRALGRPATDFAAYVQAAAATGVWNP